MFDNIERFYNTALRRATVGYPSPVELERKAGLELNRVSTKPAADEFLRAD